MSTLFHVSTTIQIYRLSGYQLLVFVYLVRTIVYIYLHIFFLLFYKNKLFYQKIFFISINFISNTHYLFEISL